MTAPRALIAGEALIDMFPTEEGRLADVKTFERAAGGAPANVAVAMARLEETPWLWTRVGTDPFGEHLSDVLAANGVDDRFIVVDPDRKTAHTLVGSDPEGDQVFLFYKEETATMAMETGAVPTDALEDVEWVHFGGVMLSDPSTREAMLDLADRATEAGCTVSFDPNTRLDLWEDEQTLVETTEAALAKADVVKTGTDDVEFIIDSFADVEDFATQVTAYGPHTVFVTRGATGTSVFATDESPWGPAWDTEPSHEVDAVDTTGAGDAFTAGMITTLLEGRSLPDVLRFANAVGALTTTQVGAMDPLPTREDVESLLTE